MRALAPQAPARDFIDVEAIPVVEYDEIAAATNLTTRAIQLRARRDAWPAQNRSVRGGQKDYFAITDLPDDVQRALVRHRLKAAQPATVREVRNTATAPAALMKDWQRDVMTARLAILAEIDRQMAQGASLNKVIDSLISAIPVVGWVGDLFFRANDRNVALLRRHLDGQHPFRRPHDGRGGVIDGTYTRL